MKITTRARTIANTLLEPFNIRLETRTAERREKGRLRQLEVAGHFESPAYPLPASFREWDPDGVIGEVAKYHDRFESLVEPRLNSVGYGFANPYFSSPDAEVLYALVRKLQPRTFLEVGSGHSTRIARMAQRDGGLPTRLIAVDPAPRVHVRELVDELHLCRVEDLGVEPFARLIAGDVLFVDSSHELRIGNDVSFLYLQVLPLLPPGVIIHVHDIFLPWEYPREWIVDNGWKWNEQLLVQCLLMTGNELEVLWPGHYAQRTYPAFAAYFPHSTDRRAQSLWLRKCWRGLSSARERDGC